MHHATKGNHIRQWKHGSDRGMKVKCSSLPDPQLKTCE